MDQCRHRIDEEAGLEPMLGQRAELPGNADPRRLIAAGKIFPPRTAPDMVAPGQLGVDGEADAAIARKSVVSGKRVSVRVDIGGSRIIIKQTPPKSIHALYN